MLVLPIFNQCLCDTKHLQMVIWLIQAHYGGWWNALRVSQLCHRSLHGPGACLLTLSCYCAIPCWWLAKWWEETQSQKLHLTCTSTRNRYVWLFTPFFFYNILTVCYCWLVDTVSGCNMNESWALSMNTVFTLFGVHSPAAELTRLLYSKPGVL